MVIGNRRSCRLGNKAASTALLQYEIDKSLRQLINLVGEKNAVRNYQLCRQAIFYIKKICGQLKDTGLFSPKPSFQFAFEKKDVDDLKKEYTVRKKASFSL